MGETSDRSPNDSKPSKHDRARESFVRWQETTRNHLGAVANLVLTLTGAAIAFGADLLVKHAAQHGCFRWLTASSMVVLLLAAAAGLAINLTRLWDFRWTQHVALMRQYTEENEGKGRPLKYRIPRWLKDLSALAKRSNGESILERRSNKSKNATELVKALKELDEAQTRDTAASKVSTPDTVTPKYEELKPEYDYLDYELKDLKTPASGEKNIRPGPERLKAFEELLLNLKPALEQHRFRELEERAQKLQKKLGSTAPQPIEETARQKTWRLIKEYCQDRYDFWGKQTWSLLLWQFVLFLTGVALLAAAVGLCPPSEESEKPRNSVTVSAVSPAGPSPEPPAIAADYIVKPGDTLEKIAKQIPEPWPELYRLNQCVIGANSNRLTPGQELTFHQTRCTPGKK